MAAHIYSVLRTALSAPGSKADWDKSLVWEKQKDHSAQVQATTTTKTTSDKQS